MVVFFRSTEGLATVPLQKKGKGIMTKEIKRGLDEKLYLFRMR